MKVNGRDPAYYDDPRMWDKTTSVPYEVWVRWYGPDFQYDAHIRRWRWLNGVAAAGTGTAGERPAAIWELNHD